MSYTQRFVQLNEFCLLEFQYSSTNPISPPLNITRVVNFSGDIQLLNPDSAIDITGNVQERSALQISSGQFVDLDKDQVPTFLQYQTSLGNITTSTISGPAITNVTYDRVLVHLVSGYNFEDKDGIILQINAMERSGKKMQLANIVFLKDSSFFQFNARPIWLGDRLYDRYFEIKVPSIKLNNDIFYSSNTPSLTLVGKITSDGLGFLRAAPINISITDISSTAVQTVGGARYKVYTIGGTKTVALNQSDEFALLSAVIQPSPAGEYFEYFASWSGGFIEDFLLNANALPGNNYVVLHEIRVFEQLGSLFYQTDVLQMIQESGFDQPKKFRPILETADRDVSFTLEYTTKLYNKADSSQIIRTANYTSFNPKEWGLQLQKLKLLNEPEPSIIYNKVTGGPTFVNEAFLNTVQSVQPFNTKYVSSFFDRFSINIQHDTVIIDKNGHLVTDKTSTTTLVYGQGDCNIIVNPFDNFFKFTILKTNGTETPAPLDLGSNATYFLVFIDNKNGKVRFPSVIDLTLADPTKGDVLFKVPESDATNIVTFNTLEFFIVSKFPDTGLETQIYQGVFNKPQDIQTVKATNDSIKTAQSTAIETKINEISTKQEAIIAQTNAIKTAPPQEQANSIAVQVEIPGMASQVPSTSKNSLIANIVPASIAKKSVATQATDAKLKIQADAKKASN